jgi:hypothetical protein
MKSLIRFSWPSGSASVPSLRRHNHDDWERLLKRHVVTLPIAFADYDWQLNALRTGRSSP